MQVWWLGTHCHPDWGSTRAGMMTRDTMSPWLRVNTCRYGDKGHTVILTEGQHMQVWWLGTHCHSNWGSTHAGMVTRDTMSPWLRVNTCRYGDKGHTVILTEGQHMQVWWLGTHCHSDWGSTHAGMVTRDTMSPWLRVNTCRYGD